MRVGVELGGERREVKDGRARDAEEGVCWDLIAGLRYVFLSCVIRSQRVGVYISGVGGCMCLRLYHVCASAVCLRPGSVANIYLTVRVYNISVYKFASQWRSIFKPARVLFLVRYLDVSEVASTGYGSQI